MYAKFQVNSSSLPKKSKVGVITPPRQRLRDQNTSLGVGLIELIKPSDTLNYKSFLKRCIVQKTKSYFVFV